MEHDERYDLVCKPAFDTLKNNQETIINLLRGQNSSPGLVDKVRDIERMQTTATWIIRILFGAVIVQVVIWIRNQIGG
jgi:hypothetical protein